MPKTRTVTITEREYDEMRKENLKLKEGLTVLAMIVKRKNRCGKKAEQIRKVVSSQLREVIKVHGPIDNDHGDIGSATKRISGQFYGLVSVWAKSLLETAGCPILEGDTQYPTWESRRRNHFTHTPSSLPHRTPKCFSGRT